MFTIVLIGAGQRGSLYAQYAKDSGLARVVAVAEPNEERRSKAARELAIPSERCYDDADALLSAGRLGDAAIIATMDQSHYAQAMRALALGYDLLLEKPISPSAAECLLIAEETRRLKRRVTVCHVLRYTPFFSKIKEIVDSRELGRIVAIEHTENIGNFHMAHSFVRGNWGNSDRSSPIVMQKSCHDMDLLYWLVDSPCASVASVGALTYFRPENAPEGSADRCLDCPVADDCRFNAKRVYLAMAGGWPSTAVCVDQRAIVEALRTSPYGRCVYRCDNNVCDHQSTLLRFENGVTATFTLCGMTNRIHRRIHIMFEHGELCGDDEDDVISVTRFASDNVSTYEERRIHVGGASGGHGGGDEGLMNSFLDRSSDGGSLSSIDKSVESHWMACAAEEARLTERVVDMAEWRARLRASARNE